MTDIGQTDFTIDLEDGKYTYVRLVGTSVGTWLRNGNPWPAAEEWKFANAINAMASKLHDTEVALHAANKRLMGDAAEIGKRAAHYGDGVQPWDLIKSARWAPEFAASNALKYVRRYLNKNGEDDLKKGRWYYHELIELCVSKPAPTPQDADYTLHCNLVLEQLELMLTKDERILLRVV